MAKNLIGLRFGRLTVYALVSKSLWKNFDRAEWYCYCDCGESQIKIIGKNLINGNTKSCGCLNREIKHGHCVNKIVTRTYKSWYGMKARCTNVNNKDYENYGGRGITVCDRWLKSFSNFLEDMGERPEDKTLDRINNNGNYEPLNCKWSTPKEQMNNQRKRK